MKRIFIITILIMIFVLGSNQTTYAASSNNDWVKNAFSAANKFMKEDATDELKIISPFFRTFQNIVKAANRILLVLLAGLSIIALSVTGVRYMLSGASPQQKEVAKQSLHTIFIGMAMGFGAYVIWRIAMSIVEIIIMAFAT